jgi:uncharacterized protein with FMN-binding domain
MARIDWHELSRRAGPIVLVAVLASWAWAFRRGAERPEPDLYPFLARAGPGASYAPLPGGGFAVERDGRTVGYAAAGSASGYGGPLTVAVGADTGGRLRRLAILEYGDTPALMKNAPAYLRQLLGRGADDGFEPGRHFDAVSGATYSSRGLAQAARAGLLVAVERGASRDASPSRIAFGPPEVCLLALVAAGAVGRNRPSLSPGVRKALRIATFVASLATIGFLFARPWTIAFPIRLLAGDWPPWRSHLYWYLLLASLLVAFSRTGRSAYCPWICPFGAAQDVVGLPFRARGRRVPHALLFAWVKRVLLWLAVLLGLLYRSPGAASYEVFAALFRLTGTGFQLAILAIVLGAALFFRRPFCHWVCPVDPTEQLARAVRVRAWRLLGRGEPRARRPIRLTVVSERPPVPVFRRLRNALLTLAGLVCALLVLGHWHGGLAPGSGAVEDGLVGRTFVSDGEGGSRR